MGDTGQRLCIGSSLLALLVPLLALCGCGERNKYQPPPPAQVSVAKPEQRKVTLYMEVTGSTAPLNRVDLVARVQGFLDTVGYKDGAAVKKGDLLFQIDQEDYKIALQIAEAAVVQQQALLLQADSDLKRKQELVKTSAVSVANVDDSRAKRDSTQAALEQAQGPGRAGQAQPRLHHDHRAFRRHRVGAPRRSGRHGRRRQPDQARHDRAARSDLREVQRRRAAGALGARAHARDGRDAEGSGSDPGRHRPADRDGISAHRHARLRGAGNRFQPPARSPARAIIDNKDGVLEPGLFVRVRIPKQVDVESLLVPDIALGNNQQGRYLLVVDDKNVVEQRQVEVGELVDGGLRIINSGLKPDDRVVVGGVMRALPGNTVVPVTASAAVAPAKGGK